MLLLTDAEDLTVADVMHRRLSNLPASATVGELRAYFAASTSRRLALVVDGTRYVGAIAASSIPDDADPTSAAAAFADPEPVIGPSAPAATARDLALDAPSQRLPVVDDAGTLVGIVAITRDRTGFCGT